MSGATMKHLDLFSGIGGFAYAVDQVWDNVRHIFCENNTFCQQVLNKHWPESEIYDDVKTFITDSNLKRSLEGQSEINPAERHETQPRSPLGIGLLTGGFPCQSFSQAGLRRGTGDIRWLWPEMFEIIRATRPTWVIAENVYGLLTWGDGVAFEQVCTDLEGSGYEVQPFIIPAAAVGAPHRRDRIWFVAHAINDGQGRTERGSDGTPDRISKEHRPEDGAAGQSQRTDSHRADVRHDSDTLDKGLEGRQSVQAARQSGQSGGARGDEGSDWSKNWLEVATELCGVDDGLPAELGGFKLSKPKHRAEQIRAYGNAIVPQVAIELMRGMAI